MIIFLRAMLIAALISGSGIGQVIVVEPDADLWGGGVTNPSGLAAIPILQYNPNNGEMWINTVGLNRISDTPTRLTVEGDDVGMAAISVLSPQAISTAPEFSGFYDGEVWNGQYFFGKQQIFTGGSGFLDPTQGIRLWTFESGLSESDFGRVDLWVNFATVLPGSAMMSGSVQFVPEPSSLSITMLAFVFLMCRANRRLLCIR